MVEIVQFGTRAAARARSRAISRALALTAPIGGAFVLVVTGCESSDDNGTASTPQVDAAKPDSGAKGDDDADADEAWSESGNDARDDSDGSTSSDGASDAADTGAPSFCESQSGLAFCADFDAPAGGDAGFAGWDQIVGGPAEVALGSTRAVSAPRSLQVSLPAGPANTDRSAKVVKTITPAGKVTQAIYELDVFVDKLPKPGAGGFLTDFQFSDTLSGGGAAADTFGFRIAVFSNAGGAFDHAELQHNAPSLPATPDDIINPFPLVGGKWNHVKMVVAFSRVASVDSVAFQAYVDSTTPAVNKTYPAPFAQAPFARVADGVVFAFDANAKEYGLSFDNITLKIQ